MSDAAPSTADPTASAPVLVARDGLLARLLDRLVHPIVLKELRQASRSAFILRAMLIVQMLAFLLASLTLLLEARELEISDAGLKLFMVASGCGILAACAVVPFYGFLALGSERDFSTIDLLHLTRLRPHGIVLGKLMACFVLGLEFCASLAPLVVLAYLLPGLDLRAVITAMVTLPLASLVLSACAIGLSGMVKSRLGRALTSVVLIIGLFLVGLYGFFGFLAAIQFGAIAGRGEFYAAIGGSFAVFLPVAALLVAAAIVPLTHPEENRAIAPRLAMLVISVSVPIVIAGFAATTGLDHEGVAAFQNFTLVLLIIAGIAAMTEPEPLPRRSAMTTPGSRLLALLRAPFLAGGGRGFLFFLVVGVVQIGGVEAVRFWANQLARKPEHSIFGDAAFYGPAATFAYALAICAPLAAMFSTSDRWKPRTRPRIWIVLAPVVVSLAAMAVGFAIDGPKGARALSRSPWNPLWLIGELSDDPVEPNSTAMLDFVAIAAAIGILLNVPRIWTGLREVLAASRARRERDRGVVRP